MICPNCQALNENENVFCVSCGTTVSQAVNLPPNTMPPTQHFQNPAPPQYYNVSNSIETAVLPVGQYNSSIPNFAPVAPYTGEQPNAKSKKIILWISVLLLGFLVIGAGGLYFVTKNAASAEFLPEHLGMFVQSREKDKVTEVKKQDFTNAVEGADKMLKDDNLIVAEEKPSLILYSDGKDVPLNDLRLIQLDTIKADGNLKQLDFQAAPVENKPEMKRIRIPDGLADGKYAFAILDGYLDDGKHKFWAFQVKNASKSSNDSALKSTTVSLKPKQKIAANPVVNPGVNPVVPQQVKPVVPPPAGGSVAYCTSNRVVFRSGPSQASGKIGGLYKGQKLYVLGYSSNYENFQNMTSNFAEVQTESGQRGWVYAAYIR